MSVKEAHIRDYESAIAPERRAYLGRVDSRPVADSAHQVLHRRAVEHEAARAAQAAAEESRDSAERKLAEERCVPCNVFSMLSACLGPDRAMWYVFE